MTYSLKVTPFAAAMLDGYCRSAGSSLKTTLGHHLTQQAPTRVADHAAATLAAVSAEQPLPTAAPAIPEPPAAAASTPQPMNPAEEDALLAVLGA